MNNSITVGKNLLTCLFFYLTCVTSVAAEDVQVFKVSGTGSGLAAMRLLVNEFHIQNPNIHIQVLASLGTTGGIMALQDGALDLSLAARPLTPSEQQLDIEYRPYAKTLIVFATNSNSEVSNLNATELSDILIGKKLHWPDGNYIRLVMRSNRETDYIPILQSDSQLADALQVALNRNDVIFSPTAQDNVQTLMGIPSSLGISSLAQINSEQLTLKPLAFENISPTITNLENGRYPFVKTFAIVHRNQNLPTALRGFVNFVFSTKACDILLANGHLCYQED